MWGELGFFFLFGRIRSSCCVVEVHDKSLKNLYYLFFNENSYLLLVWHKPRVPIQSNWQTDGEKYVSFQWPSMSCSWLLIRSSFSHQMGKKLFKSLFSNLMHVFKTVNTCKKYYISKIRIAVWKLNCKKLKDPFQHQASDPEGRQAEHSLSCLTKSCVLLWLCWVLGVALKIIQYFFSGKHLLSGEKKVLSMGAPLAKNSLLNVSLHLQSLELPIRSRMCLLSLTPNLGRCNQSLSLNLMGRSTSTSMSA